MAVLRIRIYGDPMLKRKARPVDGIGSQEKKIFEDMVQTMYSAKGAGLAATQVGIDKQLMVIDAGTGLLKLANPKIIKATCIKTGEERCLSFPGITVKVKRPQKITIEALNQAGIKVEIRAEDLLARVLQHEIDHLMGVVMIDRLGPVQRMLVSKKLKKLKQTGR